MNSTRKRIYIVGPISKGCLVTNINQATAAFVALAKAGFAPLCPHWSVYSKGVTYSDLPWFGKIDRVWCEATAMGNDEMCHADWMGIDLPWVGVSDALLRLPGESVGADMEVAHARSLDIPVFNSIETLIVHFAAKGAA